MDDDEIYAEEALKLEAMAQPRKHDKWTVLLLAADLIHNVVRDVADTMETTMTVISQHRMHKIEEEKFYEIVRSADDDSR